MAAMLTHLSIQNVVLIDRLDLPLNAGLSVLTGETGAGKSILLDALGLATGARADAGLVRAGQEKAVVTAAFDVLDLKSFNALLEAVDLPPCEGDAILRRTLNNDGRSKAFFNDQPISVTLLKTLGTFLVEVHGQHDDRGLLNPAGHRHLVDAYGGHNALLVQAKEIYQSLIALEEELAAKRQEIEAARLDQEYYQHSVEEIRELNPQKGEEQQLADERQLMMQGEKAVEDISDVIKQLTDKTDVEAAVRGALRTLLRFEDALKTRIEPVLENFDRALQDIDDGIKQLEQSLYDLEFDPDQQAGVEERLFAIRALARKHKCLPDDLPDLADKMEGFLTAVVEGDEEIARLEKAVAEADAAFIKAVETLRQARVDTAAKLDAAVQKELPDLKLEKARFQTSVQPLPREHWSGEGGDKVEFLVSTNPGAEFSPMLKVASGGEMSRIVLALKVCLLERGGAPTMIFDEVDKGIGGATADAVGERLYRLAEKSQVLVITHSPQVAARGSSHLHISKAENENSDSVVTTVTKVQPLEATERREEIARMLSGSEITIEARAQADNLLSKSA
mgnify:CR=1 FL=1